MICPMQCQHLTNFMQQFKLTASFGSSVLAADSPLSALTEEQVNANELQTFKGTVGSKSSVFRRPPYITAVPNCILHIKVEIISML